MKGRYIFLEGMYSKYIWNWDGGTVVQCLTEKYIIRIARRRRVSKIKASEIKASENMVKSR